MPVESFGWDELEIQLRTISQRLPQVPKLSVDRMATATQEYVQRRLERGIPPRLSVLTEGLFGKHAPLSGLRDKLIIAEDGDDMLIGWLPPYDKIAQILNDGAAWVPTKAQKAAVMIKAKEAGLSRHRQGDAIWIIPARPLLVLFENQKADYLRERAVRDVLKWALTLSSSIPSGSNP